jgi:hypothetical protein
VNQTHIFSNKFRLVPNPAAKALGRLGRVKITLMVFPPKGITRLKRVSPCIHSLTTCNKHQHAPSPIRQSQEYKERKCAASFVLPSFVFLLGPLVKGRRFGQRYKKVHSCHVLQRRGGTSVFSSYLPSTLPSSPSHTQSYSYILHNYVVNSDEGLTERALFCKMIPSKLFKPAASSFLSCTVLSNCRKKIFFSVYSTRKSLALNAFTLQYTCISMINVNIAYTVDLYRYLPYRC